MPASQERIVLSNCRAGCDLGIDRVDRAEQVNRRVDHMAVQIEQDAATVSRRGVLTPTVLGRGTPTFPTELVTEHLTQNAGRNRRPRGHMLSVESAVLEDRQRHTDRPEWQAR